MDKSRIATIILLSLVFITFGFYAIATFTNINAVRKIHGGYIKGFIYQKECTDEYTEHESSRRMLYDALKEERDSIDLGSYTSILLLVWIPVVFAVLMACSRIGIPTRAIGLWVSAMVALAMLYLCFHIAIDPDFRARFYTFFKGTYCDAPQDLRPQRQYFHQGILFLTTMAVVYGYFKTRVSSVGEGANSIGEALAQQLQSRSYIPYALIVLWLFTAYWVFATVRQHANLRTKVLCPYEVQMDDYKTLLMNYIYPAPDPAKYPTQDAYDRETLARFERVKDHIERNYLRIHGSLPSPAITEDDENITEYIDYLMHWRGREFETAPESTELNELRDFMYRLRTQTVSKNTMEGYFKFNKWYLLIHLVVILYLVFHLLYIYNKDPDSDEETPFERWMTLLVAGGIIGGLFLLSWYAWFDVALRI
jgi:hypothetical protein